MDDAVKGLKMASITAFFCHNCLYGGADAEHSKKAGSKGVHLVELPCGSRLQPIHILKAFENGADGVVVAACPVEECKMMRGSRRLERRVEYTKALLGEAGLEPERLVFLRPEPPAAPEFERIIREAEAVFEKIGPSPLK